MWDVTSGVLKYGMICVCVCVGSYMCMVWLVVWDSTSVMGDMW